MRRRGEGCSCVRLTSGIGKWGRQPEDLNRTSVDRLPGLAAEPTGRRIRNEVSMVARISVRIRRFLP